MGKFINLIGEKFDTWEPMVYLGKSRWKCICSNCGAEKEFSTNHLKNGRYGVCDCINNKFLKIGTQFGDYTIETVIDSQNYICKCICGKMVTVTKQQLLRNSDVKCSHNKRDLTGEHFGKWKVLEPAGGRMWKCQCSCGTIKNVQDYSLTSGKSTSCGKCNTGKINVGDKFGEWKVLEKANKEHMVLCKCSCGKEKLVNEYTLKSGKSTSCGHTMNQDRLIDLTDRQFGELKATRYLGNELWECQCSCGKIVKVHRNHLLDGRATSCGHGTSRAPEDLTGRTFGKLRAIRYVGNKSWECLCDCGKTKVILAANLKNGSTISCGCELFTPTKEELIDAANKYEQTHILKPTVMDLAAEFDVSYKSMLYHLNKYGITHDLRIMSGYSSQGERELYNYIQEICEYKVLHNIKNVIDTYELDIYIPDMKLAVEFNGSYWHSTLNKEENYHQLKTLACAKQGIQLIHVFEYEWNNPIKQSKIKQYLADRISNKSEIKYAREFDVVEIESSKAAEFCDIYHLQGQAKSKINIALMDRQTKEVYGVMTFGSPRFSSICEYELIRLAYKTDVKIVGGSERMFKHFIEKYNPNSIVSYCDISKFKGNVYIKLGFTAEEISKPNYVWVQEHTGDVLSRYQTMKSDLVKQGKGTSDETEYDIMTKLGYFKICDSGNLRLIWDGEIDRLK